MKIQNIRSLEIPEIKLIRFEKFIDSRGFFSEVYNINDIRRECPFLGNFQIMQANEAYSHANTFRGLHFQWNPHMGKLVRLIYGKLIDLALDLRPDSITYGKIVGCEVKCSCDYADWIWIPPGFAHGALLLEKSMIEYFCTGTYNPENERTISIFSDDIDWSICNKEILNIFNNIDKPQLNIKDRDLHAMTFTEWKNTVESKSTFINL